MGSSRRRTALAVLVAAALGGQLAVATVAAAAVPPPVAAPVANAVNIVDTSATPETRSLFSYLNTTRGKKVLFGAQHTTDNGITFTSTGPASTQSDVKGATGDYPAIFGFDTLILEGLEKPGVAGASLLQNVAPLVTDIQTAHSLGGIPEISAHMENFATGNNFNDTTGRPVSHILPGGDKNAEFNSYLDAIAKTANTSTDEQGNLIPMIFRPFHENTGSFFWWGAGHATTGEYKEIFRYTVEYLRDTANVHNLLYAFSPNGAFGGDEAKYLDTYPGDPWVDILGYDNYENSNDSENSDAYVATVVTDLAMISRTADARGKIAAFTEFGRNGARTIAPTGNKSLSFFTDLLHGIEANPDAKRIAYMLTWANFGGGQIYVPNAAYTDADGNPQPANELLPDFQAFYANDYSGFASDIPADAETRAGLTATPATPTVRVVSPADGVRIIDPMTTVRVKATVDTPVSAVFTVGSDTTTQALTLGADGYWQGTWNIGADNLNNASTTVHAVVTYDDGTTTSADSDVILGEAPTLANGVVDTFEGYSDNAALRAAYTYNNASASDLTLSKPDASQGTYGVRFAYDFSAREYGGFGRIFPSSQDWSGFSELDAHLVPDGSNQKIVLQLTAGGATFEAYPSLAGTTPEDLKVPFAQFADKAGAHPAPTAAQLKDVTQFYVYLNKTDSYTGASSIGLDDIHAAGATTPPGGGGGTGQPSVVENFESYADTAALQDTWNGQSSGTQNLTLSTDPVGSGTKSGKFSFDFSGTNPTFVGIGRRVAQDWSGDAELSLWAQPTNPDQKVTVQFVASGVYYEGSATLSGTAAQQVTILFGDAVPSGFQNLDPALRPTAAQLANVSGVSVFLSKQGGTASDTGAIYLDDITAQPVTATPPAGPTVIDVPTAPVWTDTCGLDDNGSFSGYADTDRYTWKVTDHSTRNGKVGIVVTAKDGYAFPDGSRTRFTRTQDNSRCAASITATATAATCAATGAQVPGSLTLDETGIRSAYVYVGVKTGTKAGDLTKLAAGDYLIIATAADGSAFNPVPAGWKPSPSKDAHGNVVKVSRVVTVAGTTCATTPAAWSASVVYTSGDRVSLGGAVWQASWWTQNQKPGSPTGPWQEIAPAGPNGVAAWTPSRVYTEGDTVSWHGASYSAQWWTRNQEPGGTAGPWVLT